MEGWGLPIRFWDGDCEFLGCRKAFFYTGEVPPTHASSSHSAFPYHFKRRDTKRGGKERERERDIERERVIYKKLTKTRTKFWRSMKLGVIYTPGFLRQRQAARRSHQVLSIVFFHKIDGQNLVRSTRLALF